MSAWVYRCYAADGTPVYIGATTDLPKRLDAHRRSSWWAHRVAKVRAQVFPSMREALDVERSLIRSERPRCNVMGRGGDRAVWTRRDYLDYALARSMAGSAYTNYVKKHLARLHAEYQARFGEPMPTHLSPQRVPA